MAETMPSPPTTGSDVLSSGASIDDEEEEDQIMLSPGSPSPPPHASLREISSLASWTVSTYKPGCGVSSLLAASPALFWQSDGPQPHLLNVHFFKLVGIVRLRIYLDFELDESYTPTRLLFLAGTSDYDLAEFADWAWPLDANGVEEGPRGWVDVNLEGVGGEDGDVLRAMMLQIRVCENHQNGKDTHVRGVQIFARAEGRGVAGSMAEAEREGDGREERRIERWAEESGMEEPEWMGEPILR